MFVLNVFIIIKQYLFIILEHVRTRSIGSSLHTLKSSNDTVRCLHIEALKAHNQPVTVLETNGAYIVTGSQDHMLKVGKTNYKMLKYVGIYLC